MGHLNYLLELQPPKQLITWLNGFGEDGRWHAKKFAAPPNSQMISSGKRKCTTKEPTKMTPKCSKETEVNYIMGLSVDNSNVTQ